MKKVLTSAILVCLTTTLFAQKLVPAVDHIALCVKNYDKCVAFYKDIFGFESMPVMYDHNNKDISCFKIGQNLQLYIIKGARNMEEMNRGHITLVVDSMELFTQKLDNYQVRWFSGGKRKVVTTLPEGNKQIFLVDPSGYTFEVVTPVKRVREAYVATLK
jgi:lactoylglutathione lyase